MALRVVFALSATALSLVLFEGAARVLTAFMGVPPSQSDSALSGSPELGWERRPGFEGPTGDAHHRSFDSQGYQSIDSDQLADHQTPRVVFIGDSNTFGYGVPTQSSFVEVVDTLLAGVNTINLGVPGYTSAQGVLVARKFIPVLRPAVAVISFNFNDRRYSGDLPDGDDRFRAVYLAHGEPRLNRLIAIADHSHAFRVFRALVRRMTTSSREGPGGGDLLDLGTVVPRVSVDDYKKNLAAIVSECLANGVRPIFLLLRDDPAQTRLLHALVASAEAGDLTSAAHGLESIIEKRTDSIASTEALARIYLAAAYRQSGRAADAARILQVRRPSTEVDGYSPIRLDTAYNRAMTEVAADLAVEVIDGASLIEHGGAFIDLSHFDETGHRRVGERIAARLADILGTPPSHPGNP